MSDKKSETDRLKDDNIFEKFDIPFKTAVQPQQLTLDSKISFSCYKGIKCFNACCSNIDITLTPYDILRLARHLDIPTWKAQLQYTRPYEMDSHSMPGVKMRPVEGGTACQFMTEEGCSVYEDRPTACRYYPFGTMGMRRKDSGELEDVYFIVKEDHCKGHDEDNAMTIAEFREQQGVKIYDTMNREWLDIIVKKRSAGPTVGAPSERSMQLFSMSYDLDAFRMFTQSDGFIKMFDLDSELRKGIDEDDTTLTRFCMRFLKQVLFGEHTIKLKEGAAKLRYEERKDVIKSKHEENVKKYSLRDPTEGTDDT
ncbi:MAG TPA: YkgJ family cysteine cluster protein [Gammaproteobacteria bacterium]|nr:YkgJ family cysteine cluster protein [Gammaproteobacteria bacterium]